MKISVLILTHNRPRLFERCIRSIVANLPEYDIEILVNNDTSDITEVHDPRVNIMYFYQQAADLSTIYQSLFDRAVGEYVFFLEDDDYILPCFFDELDFSYDINFVNFMAHDPKHTISRALKPFVIDEDHFQLSQIIFKKALLTRFPAGNNINNDWILFKSLTGSMLLNKRPLWVQTTDGQDNISFLQYNTDARFPTLQ